MAKKSLNWLDIKTRFLACEKPSDIAKDYRDCSAGKISQYASRHGWVAERDELRNNITKVVQQELAEETKTQIRRVSGMLRENAEKAAVIEGELLDVQLKMIREGHRFICFLEGVIRQYAFEEEENYFLRRALIKELRDSYDAIFCKMLPPKLAVAAFQSARAESDLVADEEHQKEHGGERDSKKGFTAMLGILRQGELVPVEDIEDED
jgi:hypothetical protein